MFVKRLSTKLYPAYLIDRQCKLVQWFSFFNMVHLNRIYDSCSDKVIETLDLQFDILQDDCTISETAAIGLLFLFLQALKQNGRLFSNPKESEESEIKKLASSIKALLFGTYVGDATPGQALACNDSCLRGSMYECRDLRILLDAMSCDNEVERPTTLQCLDFRLFKTVRAQVAVERIKRSVCDIVVSRKLEHITHTGKAPAVQ